MVNPHISFLIDLYKKTTTPNKEKAISLLQEKAYNTEILSETIQCSEESNLHNLYIEATNNCNLSCIFCPRSKITREKGYMDMKLYKHIIDDAVDFGILAISLHGFGEPLLHPDIIDMIKYAKEKGIRTVSFNTNGMLLSEDFSLKLIESGLDNIAVSIDSINPEIYKHMRIGGNLETVIKNIVYLKELKDQLNILNPRIYVQCMVTKLTFDEEVAACFGTFANMISYGTLGSRSNSIEGLKELQLAVSPENRKKSCEFLGTGYAIYWNGDVTVCCGDFNGEHIFGNIKKSSLKELSNNKKLLSFYKIHKDKQFDKVPFCNVCDSDCFPSLVLSVTPNKIFKVI